jgi:hypothetical protein
MRTNAVSSVTPHNTNSKKSLANIRSMVFGRIQAGPGSMVPRRHFIDDGTG